MHWYHNYGTSALCIVTECHSLSPESVHSVESNEEMECLEWKPGMEET